MFREEESFRFTPKEKEVEKTDNKVSLQLTDISKQIDIISRYVAMLSKRVDDALALTRVQEEKIKDIESRIEALTARELE